MVRNVKMKSMKSSRKYGSLTLSEDALDAERDSTPATPGS